MPAAAVPLRRTYLHEALAPLALLALVGAGVALSAAGLARLAFFAYPLLALGLGAALYARHPVAYVGFGWGVLLFTPFVRRVVDLYIGYQSVSLVMLAPYLVTGLSVLSLVRHRRAARDAAYAPFLLALAGVALGYASGLVQNGVQAATFDLLEWGAPIAFGLHTALAWRRYPDLRRVLSRTFAWGILLVGLYGVAQFFVLPEWDRQWMLESGMYDDTGPYVITYIGLPEPLEVRVFSTLNAPGPNGMIVMAGVLLLIGVRGALRVPAMAAGLATLLLSLVRSAWGGWVVGVAYLLVRAPQRLRVRALLAVVVVGLAGAVAVASVPPLRATVAERAASLAGLASDTSLRERADFIGEVLRKIARAPLGYGLGSTGTATKLTQGATSPFDAGLLNVPYALGWGGGALFLGGALVLLLRAARSSRRDGFATAAEAAALGMFAQMLFVNTLISTVGFVFWCLLGASLACRLSSTHSPHV